MTSSNMPPSDLSFSHSAREFPSSVGQPSPSSSRSGTENNNFPSSFPSGLPSRKNSCASPNSNLRKEISGPLASKGVEIPLEVWGEIFQRCSPDAKEACRLLDTSIGPEASRTIPEIIVTKESSLPVKVEFLSKTKMMATLCLRAGDGKGGKEGKGFTSVASTLAALPPGIRYLELDHFALGNAGELEAVPPLENLESLRIDNSSLSLQELAMLLKSAPNLESLCLRNPKCQFDTDVTVVDFPMLLRAKSMDLSGAKLSAPVFKALLVSAPNLKHLNLSNNLRLAKQLVWFTKSKSLPLQCLQEMESLELPDFGFFDSDAQLLKATMPKLQVIKPLNLEQPPSSDVASINPETARLTEQHIQRYEKVPPAWDFGEDE